VAVLRADGHRLPGGGRHQQAWIPPNRASGLPRRERPRRRNRGRTV